MANTVETVSGFHKTAIALLAAGVVTVTAAGALDLVSGDRAPHGQAAVPPPAAEPTTALRQTTTAAAPVAKPARVVSVSSAGKLSDLFRRVGYELSGVREKGAVPRLLLAALPQDLGKLSRPEQRKIMFIKSMLPLVLHANEEVLHQRKRLKELQGVVARGGSLSADDEAWLDRIADYYGLDEPDFDALMERVDVVPPSLAIAQAAEESGWGTSRFAREGNAVFGQRVYHKGRDGMVPKERGDGKKFKVRAFDHLLDGVKAYVHNLNSHFAYDDFREMRAKMRENDRVIDGYKLVGTLDRYSERGDAYIDTIRTIIRANRLRVFDRAWLREVAGDDDTGPDA